MTIKSLKVLVELAFPSRTLRYYDGAGPILGSDGNVWAGATLTEGLDRIESAMNGEASMVAMALCGVDQGVSDLAYEDLESGDVIGSSVRILLQACDEFDQPDGDPEVRFTGTIDNMPSDDTVSGDQIRSNIAIEVTNRFDLRTQVSGAVLSDVDHRAQSAVLNPTAPTDQAAERIVGLADKSIVWPRFS